MNAERMKRIAAALVLSAGTLLAAEKPLEESLYFYCDFDSPLLVANEVFPMRLDEEGYVPGASGNGYYFRHPGFNWYAKKTADGSDPDAFQNVPLRRAKPEVVSVSDMMTELEDEGPANEKKKDRDATKLYPDEDVKENREALVFTGGTVNARGGTLCVKPARVETDTKWRTTYVEVLTGSAWVKGRAGSIVNVELAPSAYPGSVSRAYADWKGKHPDEKVPPFQPDTFHPSEVKLTGEWQRVAAYVTFDCRLNERDIAFNIETRDRSPFEAKQFQLEIRSGEIPEPADWMPGKTSIYGNEFTVSNPELVSKFPVNAGAMFYRMKYKDGPSNLPETNSLIFSCGKITAGENSFFWPPGKPLQANAIRRTTENPWHSIAVTWDAGSIRMYADGKLTGSRTRSASAAKRNPKEIIRFGYSGWRGGLAANLLLDDFMIFNRTISTEEVNALTSRTTPLRSGRNAGLLCMGNFGTMFYRNEDPARITFGVYAAENASGAISCTVGGQTFPSRKITLEKGENLVRALFEAWKFEIGKYPYEVTIRTANGMEFRNSGTLEIIPGRNVKEFKFLNWGGMAPVAYDYLRKLGINTTNFNSHLEAEKILRDGLYLNPRLENSGSFWKWKYDKQKIADSTFRAMRNFSGYAGWVMTLCNSEVYGSGNIDSALSVPLWRDYVQKKYGFLPEKNLFSSTGIRRPKDFKAPDQGIYDDNDPATRTNRELVANAQGPMLVNEINREVIRKLSPDNIVWSEPMVPFGVDMTASWEYDFGTAHVLYGLKMNSKAAEDASCRYMPTLSMGYGNGFFGQYPLPEEKTDPLKAIKAEDDLIPEMADPEKIEKETAKPKTVKIGLPQTDDDLIINTFLALGAIRADALSIFTICSWPEGLKNSALSVPEPGEYAMPGTGDRYADMMHRVFHPMAEMLADVPCAKNKVAIYVSDSSSANAQMWWSYYHFTRSFQGNFGSMKLNYDILTDNSTKEDFRSYKHIFFPAARAVTRSNYEKLLATKDTSTIWADRYCLQKYPNMKRYDDPDNEKNYSEATKKTVGALRESLKNELDIYADGDVPGSVVTAKRISNGTPYFLVVNDARTTGPMNRFAKDATWWKPYGQSQKVKISFLIPEKSVVYDFVTSKEVPYTFANGRAEIILDMEPAQGMLLCVYPAKFQEIRLEKPAEFRPGKNILRVTVLDESGKKPSGRQLVTAKIRSGGTLRDESGHVVLRDGVGEILLYLRNASDAASLEYELTERTSGLHKTFH